MSEMKAAQQGPPPAPADFEVEITPDHVERFRADGWLRVERITTDEEVAWLGEVWDELFANRRIWFDLATPFGRNDEPTVGQIIFPEKFAPTLRQTLYFRNARAIASRLLAHVEDDLDAWGHMVLKPAQTGRATPWHQDEAYWEAEFDYHAVGAWLPLEPVDSSNGCMCFVPGSHRGELLPHRALEGDPRLHLLELDGPADVSGAVEAPLAVGGATFHHPRTLHSTAPNSTPRPRRAFANGFQTRPVRRKEPRSKPWIEEQRRVWTEERERTSV